MKDKVVVGMSGGVDSSVAAAILKEEGYDVIGLFMRNWHEEDADGICTAESDFQDVKNVCNQLDIPYFSIDFSKEYQARVFEHFLQEYKRGRTPNPDVLCNKEIKFDAFLKYAMQTGAKYVATGHYCKVGSRDGKTWLMRARDENKDQTYFLNQVSHTQLKNVLFPLGDLLKPDIRKLAAAYGFSTAEKKDSTGICFIGERDFRKFLSEYLPMKKGDIKTPDGRIVGEHQGVYYYTVGQRKGLGIGGGMGVLGEPWFVVGKDVEKNILYVTEGETDALFSAGLCCETFHFITEKSAKTEFECMARIRHRQPLQKAVAKCDDKGGLQVVFEQKQRAVAEGQYAVLYDGEICLGGGVIDEKF